MAADDGYAASYAQQAIEEGWGDGAGSPSPHQLWQQSVTEQGLGTDLQRERYLELMRGYGHLLPKDADELCEDCCQRVAAHPFDLEAIEAKLPIHGLSADDGVALVAEARRLTDLVAEFQRRDESATRRIRCLTEERDRLHHFVFAVVEPAAEPDLHLPPMVPPAGEWKLRVDPLVIDEPTRTVVPPPAPRPCRHADWLTSRAAALRLDADALDLASTRHAHPGTSTQLSERARMYRFAAIELDSLAAELGTADA